MKYTKDKSYILHFRVNEVLYKKVMKSGNPSDLMRELLIKHFNKEVKK